MNKICAYTIMEMVIVMLLSGIVISISFKSFDILSKSYMDFKGSQDTIAQYATLDRLLTLDFMRCREVRKTEDGLDLIFTGSKIQYTILPDLLLRRQASLTDTFKLVAENISLKFKKNECKTEGHLVDEFLFEDNYRQELETYHYTKQYGADILMREEVKDLLNE
jgi:hypothetical protein